MDASKTPLPAVKGVDAVPQSSGQVPVSTSTTGPEKANPAVPDGYKIVKVRKPDGTIVKVRRPIVKDTVTGAASTSTTPSKVVAQPATPSTAALSASKPLSGTVREPAKTQTVLPGREQAQKVATEKSSGAITSEATPKKTEANPKTTVNPPAHTSKLDAVSKSSRIFRRFHRVHKHASRFVEAFDPYSDVGDYEDGDIFVSEDSDNDSDNDSGSESDDSDRRHNGQQSNTSSSGVGRQGPTTSTGYHPANNKTGPKITATKTGVSAHERPENKSTSTELTKDALVVEKEVLTTNGAEDAKNLRHGPKRLTRRSTQWEKVIVWALVILLPLAFIGLGIATSTLDGRPTTSMTDTYNPDDYSDEVAYYPTNMSVMLYHATKAAITAWPIVFAAILAYTLKALATYKVERGIQLMTLEQLISSHSVASAIKQPFVLRRLNWLTIGLFGLWALSPLGSQAMQYTTNTVANIIQVNGTLYYLNTAVDNPGLSTTWEALDAYSDSMDVLYAAVFQQVTQYQPYGSDPWGNALIPVYEYLNLSAPINTNKVMSVDPYTTNFSSYYGIPLATYNFSEYDGDYDGTWNFTIRSSYLYFDCPSLRFETLDQISLDLDQYDMDLDDLWNTTSGSLRMAMEPPSIDQEVGNLTFLSSCSKAKINGSDTYAYSVCSMSQTFVDSNVSCADSNCTVKSTQKLSGIPPTNITDFIEEFMKASDTGLSDYPYIGNSSYSFTELYLQNPDTATEPGAGDSCDLTYLANDTWFFTKQLSYLINTFYSTGFTHDYQVGSIKANQTLTLSNGTADSIYTVHLTNFTTGVHKYQSDIAPELFKIDWAFIVIFEFCALALLLIGIAGVLLESRTISPDILGFASSIARHSKYVKLPKVDGTMSGGERANALRNVKVMMQDVRADDDIGKIVLGTVNEGAVRLRPGRLYK